MVGGCRWTVGRCTETRSPPPSTTTPVWKCCSPSRSGCASPTAAVDVDVLAQQVIATMQASRASWQEHHVRAEAERACRRLAAVPDFLVDAVADRALSPANSVLITVPSGIDEPRELRRSDGS